MPMSGMKEAKGDGGEGVAGKKERRSMEKKT